MENDSKQELIPKDTQKLVDEELKEGRGHTHMSTTLDISGIAPESKDEVIQVKAEKVKSAEEQQKEEQRKHISQHINGLMSSVESAIKARSMFKNTMKDFRTIFDMIFQLTQVVNSMGCVPLKSIPADELLKVLPPNMDDPFEAIFSISNKTADLSSNIRRTMPKWISTYSLLSIIESINEVVDSEMVESYLAESGKTFDAEYKSEKLSTDTDDTPECKDEIIEVEVDIIESAYGRGLRFLLLDELARWMKADFDVAVTESPESVKAALKFDDTQLEHIKEVVIPEVVAKLNTMLDMREEKQAETDKGE